MRQQEYYEIQDIKRDLAFFVIILLGIMGLMVVSAEARTSDEELYAVNPGNIDAIAKAITSDDYSDDRYHGSCIEQAMARYSDLTTIMKVDFPVYVADIIPLYHSVVAIQTKEDITDFNSYRFIQYHNPDIRPGDVDQMPFYNIVNINKVYNPTQYGYDSENIIQLYTGNKTIPYNVTDYSGVDKCRVTFVYLNGKCVNKSDISQEIVIKPQPKQTTLGFAYTFGHNDTERYQIEKNIGDMRAIYIMENIAWSNGLYPSEFEKKYNIR